MSYGRHRGCQGRPGRPGAGHAGRRAGPGHDRQRERPAHGVPAVGMRRTGTSPELARRRAPARALRRAGQGGCGSRVAAARGCACGAGHACGTECLPCPVPARRARACIAKLLTTHGRGRLEWVEGRALVVVLARVHVYRYHLPTFCTVRTWVRTHGISVQVWMCGCLCFPACWRDFSNAWAAPHIVKTRVLAHWIHDVTDAFKVMPEVMPGHVVPCIVRNGTAIWLCALSACTACTNCTSIVICGMPGEHVMAIGGLVGRGDACCGVGLGAPDDRLALPRRCL